MNEMRNILIECTDETEVVSIGSLEDLFYHAEEKMGVEYRKYLEEFWESRIDEVRLEKECINEELEDAKDELDNKDDAIRGAIDYIEAIIKKEMPDEIRKALEGIEGILWNSL